MVGLGVDNIVYGDQNREHLCIELSEEEKLANNIESEHYDQNDRLVILKIVQELRKYVK